MPVVVAAIFSRRGVLLIRRAKAPFAGMWGLPGGKVQFGEHLDDAVRREVLEETGLDAQFREFCGVVTELVSSRGKSAQHYVLLVCRLSSLRTRVRASDEGPLEWRSIDEIEQGGADVIPSDRLILEKLVLRVPQKRFYRCNVRERAGRYVVERFE